MLYEMARLFAGIDFAMGYEFNITAVIFQNYFPTGLGWTLLDISWHPLILGRLFSPFPFTTNLKMFKLFFFQLHELWPTTAPVRNHSYQYLPNPYFKC